ncbi:MAG: UvrD-helicase domain-containing protein [Planctomycetes bacterium]|nr:UvrD-helicase domain-containing protein [Planctomycetota bacterium]
MSAPRGASVVLASAGSGKTYSLTTHFLALVAAGVPPERVLATTFTRKAAGEILDRIFARLVRASRDERERAELDAALGGAVPSRARAAELAAGLARHVERCRVMTIDSFFVVLARAFAAELGLAPDWRIADEFDDARARDAAVAAALEDGSTERWILLLRELERAKTSREVHATLVARVRDAHELFLESRAEAWSALAPPPRADAATVERLAKRLAALAPPLTKQGKPNQTWVNGLAKLRGRAAAGEWEALVKDGIAAKVIAGEEKYGSAEIGVDTRALVTELVRVAAAELGAVLEGQNRATREFVEHFAAQFTARLAERGWLRFADLPRALAADATEARDFAEELAWRLDAELDHLLLDEFQDTSPAQWRVLRPLAEELAADGSGAKSFFCVGDTKQSIYGWRGGDPRLLEGVAAWPTVERRSLTVSYRSAPVVLAAVNRIFADLAASAAFADSEAALAAARKFRFDAHSAAKPKLTGVVRALFVDAHGETGVGDTGAGDTGASNSGAGGRKGGGADAVRAACRAAAVEHVVELARRAPRATIAILVRRKAQVGPLVYALRRRGLAASGESGNPLTDATAVQVALSALHLAEHPADTAAWFHVAHSPLAAPLGIAWGMDRATLRTRARKLREHVLERGFAETLESFRPAFGAANAWETRRFERLIEFAIALENDPLAAASASIDEFVARVRDERVEDPSAAAIKVMTIHAAKGLEFDAVVLCDLAFEFERVPAALVWRRVDEDPRREIEAVSRHAAKEWRNALHFVGAPRLAELHLATSTRAMYDELCALYVATTRARRELVFVLPPVDPADPSYDSAAVVALALGIAGKPPGEAWVLDGSDERWVAEFEAPKAASAAGGDAAPAVRFREPSSAPAAASVAPSKRGPGAPLSLRLHFAPTTAARRRGLRLHLWLAEVEWLEAFARTDAELVELARAADLGGVGLERDLADFRRLLGTPAARDVLSRAENPGDVEAWRERRYLLPAFAAVSVGAGSDGGAGPDGEVERGAFDRVLVERGARRARIVDFKSDAGLDDESRLAERTAHHAPQLRAYRAALARLLSFAPDAIRTDVWFLEAGVVRTIE